MRINLGWRKKNDVDSPFFPLPPLPPPLGGGAQSQSTDRRCVRHLRAVVLFLLLLPLILSGEREKMASFLKCVLLHVRRLYEQYVAQTFRWCVRTHGCIAYWLSQIAQVSQTPLPPPFFFPRSICFEPWKQWNVEQPRIVDPLRQVSPLSLLGGNCLGRVRGTRELWGGEQGQAMPGTSPTLDHEADRQETKAGVEIKA